MNDIEERNVVNTSFGVNLESVEDLTQIKPELGALVMYRGVLHYADGTTWYSLTGQVVR